MQKVSKPSRSLNGTIHLPASKSISNRLLILRHLHPDHITVANLSAAEDTVLLESLLHKIRNYQANEKVRILNLDVRNSGTVMRFLTALLTITPGSFVLQGDPRMAFRPIQVLVSALQELGADIQFLENVGYLPVYIKGRNLISRDIPIDASESSQHISAILLVSTAITDGLRILLEGQVVSRPYIDMTCLILEKCGFPTIWQEEMIRVFPGKKQKVSFVVEPDWSSSAFWYGMMALAEEGEILFPGLRKTGVQGDEVVAELYSHLGVKTEEVDEGIKISKQEFFATGFEWDFKDCPDLALPVIVTCALLGVEGVFRGMEGLRIKESDRIQSIQEELGKLNGALVQGTNGFWHLKPVRSKKKKLKVHSHMDHRIVMAMMMAAMIGLEVEIADPEVVSKSYPGFWRDMTSTGFEM